MPIAALTLVPIVLQIIGKFFPVGSTVASLTSSAAQVLPGLISAAQSEFALFQSGQPPTAQQQAEIDAAFEQAHALMQGAQPGAPLPSP